MDWNVQAQWGREDVPVDAETERARESERGEREERAERREKNLDSRLARTKFCVVFWLPLVPSLRSRTHPLRFTHVCHPRIFC